MNAAASPSSRPERFKSKGRQRSIGRRLKTIEADKNQFGERLETSRQNAIRHARGNHVGGMADRIGPAGAGVGHDDRGPFKSERLLQIENLLLGRYRATRPRSRECLWARMSRKKFSPKPCRPPSLKRKAEAQAGASARRVEQPGRGQGFARGGARPTEPRAPEGVYRSPKPQNPMT